jgi:DNA-binding MarR family transcriptional regulator
VTPGGSVTIGAMTGLTGEHVRELLQRRDAAASAYRAQVARRLGLTDSEMLAVVHLAREGECTPSRLGSLLDLSSGGITAMVQRLEAAGHVVREPHPHDRRSSLVRLAPAVAELASGPDEVAEREGERARAELAPGEQTAVLAVLTALADATEALVDGEPSRRAPPPAPAVPSLWA